MIADLVGKGGHVRTVPIPAWVKNHVDAWTAAAAITHGPVFRAINKAGRVWGEGMSPKVLWDVVRSAAARAGIDKLAPHDLRRTCARVTGTTARADSSIRPGRLIVARCSLRPCWRRQPSRRIAQTLLRLRKWSLPVSQEDHRQQLLDRMAGRDFVV